MKCQRCGCNNQESTSVCRDCGAGLERPAAFGPGRQEPESQISFSVGAQHASTRPPAPDFQFSVHPNTSRRCGRCGASNASQSRFCAGCGASLASSSPVLSPPPEAGPGQGTLQCVRCNADSPEGMRFCQSCGAALPAQPDAYVSAAPAAQASLIVIGQDGSPGQRFPIGTDQTDIGREEGDIRLANDPYVSPRHARIRRENGRLTLTDLASINGVFVGVTRPEPLRDGDLVLIGLQVLRFQVVSETERALTPAMEGGTRLFGSPANTRFARLDQRTVEGVTRDVFYLTREETVIGRELGDIVFSSDPFMSRRHAAIVRNAQSGTFSIKDLASSNGTYVRIRGHKEIGNFDHIRIGQHLFRLETGPAREQNG